MTLRSCLAALVAVAAFGSASSRAQAAEAACTAGCCAKVPAVACDCAACSCEVCTDSCGCDACDCAAATKQPLKLSSVFGARTPLSLASAVSVLDGRTSCVLMASLANCSCDCPACDGPNCTCDVCDAAGCACID